MTQTSAPKSWPWLEALKLFAPTINQALIMLASAVIGAAGTLGAQMATGWSVTPARATVIETVKTTPEPGSLSARLKVIEDEFEELKKKQAAPPRVRATKAKQG